MDEEYEIYHYGFSVAQLKQETQDMIQFEVGQSCDVLVKSITTSPLINNDVAAEIEQKKNILAKEIGELFKDSFKKMENIISENFSIPLNVTLSSDRAKLKNIDEDEEHLQKTYDEHMKVFMQYEQYMTTLKGELDSYNNLEHLFEMQRRTAEAVDASLSNNSNCRHFLDLVAEMTAKLKQSQ